MPPRRRRRAAVAVVLPSPSPGVGAEEEIQSLQWRRRGCVTVVDSSERYMPCRFLIEFLDGF